MNPRIIIAILLLAVSALSHAAPSISNVSVTPAPLDNVNVISAPNKTLVTISFKVSDSNVTALNFLAAGFLNGASCSPNKIGVRASAIQSAQKPTVEWGMEKSEINKNVAKTPV